MAYRTKTYIAGDWTGDQDLISKLYEWNNSNFFNLSFTDAHQLTQARDTSLYCTVKRSLSERLDASKTFVLIVGKMTKSLTKGSCQYCDHYSSYFGRCLHNMHVDFKSYIEYECEKAKHDGLTIVVIYNYASVDKSKCPEILKNTGTHINGYYYDDNWNKHWNYSKIRDALT